MSVTPSSARVWRSLVCSCSIATLLVASGCKDKLEDLPDIDPVEDPWVDQIDTGNDADAAAAAEVAVAEPTPAAGELGDPAADPAAVDPTAVDPTADPAADPAAPDPATAEAAKLAGASVPSSKPASGTSNNKAADPAAPADPSAPADPAAPAEPTPAAAPAPAAEPAPAAKPAEPPKPAPITMADYNGTFRFSGGNAQREELAAAIEFGANQVASVIRGIARKRLTKTQIIEDPVTISVTGDRLEFKWGTTGDGMVVTIDGPTTTMQYQGDKYKVRARQKDGKLITTFQAPDATKTIVYSMNSDRQKMTAYHKLVADQLSEPVTFKVSYTRK